MLLLTVKADFFTRRAVTQLNRSRLPENGEVHMGNASSVWAKTRRNLTNSENGRISNVAWLDGDDVSQLGSGQSRELSCRRVFFAPVFPSINQRLDLNRKFAR